MDKDKIVVATTEYIEQALAGQGEAGLSLDDIADRVGYSKFYLNRIFREQVGTTIHQYIVERRLTEAAKELVHTQKSIADIAYQAGYQSQQAFTAAFRAVYLRAPMEYRLSRRWVPLRRPHTALALYHSAYDRGMAA